MRNTVRWGLAILLASFCCMVWLGDAWAQPAQPASEVKTVKEVLGERPINELRTVEGFAIQWIPAGPRSTAFFLLKDDYGDLIMIRTSGEKPETNGRYRIRGPVGSDRTIVSASELYHSDLYISEEVRDVVWKPGTGITTGPTETGGVSQKRKLTTELIAGLAVVLLILAALLTWLLVRRKRAGTATVGTTTPAPSATGPAKSTPAPQKIEGRTIKIFAPPPGTLKMLPGRLIVLAGDETVKEISFYRVGGQVTPEVTFGRVDGPPYTHVQFKQMTVSSRQAKLTFIDNQWVLTNFAPSTSNPTRHNGSELAVDGQVKLAEGDKIEMGEVKFEFRTK